MAQRKLPILFACIAALLSLNAWADKCSSWMDKAWLNEYYYGQNPYLEIYSKDSAFPSAWQQWKISVYSRQDQLMIPKVVLTNSTAFACTKQGSKTWVTHDVTDNGLDGTVGLVVLEDAAGKYVDAFAFDNTVPPQSWTSNTVNFFPTLASSSDGCPALANRLSTQAGQISNTNRYLSNMLNWPSQGNKDYARQPDGGPISKTNALGNYWYLTSETGSNTTYTTCTTNNANLTKTSDVYSAPPGGTVKFALSIANASNSALTGVTVLDTLPTETPTMTFVSATSSTVTDVITYSTDDVTYTTSVPTGVKYVKWQPTAIPSGSRSVLTVTMQVPTDATPNVSSYSNNASMTGATAQADSAVISVVSPNTPSFLVTASPSSSCTGATGSQRPLVTVTRKDQLNGAGNTVTNYTGTVTLATSSTGHSTTWTKASAQGTLTGNTYAFDSNDHGVATFYLTDSVAETIDIVASDVYGATGSFSPVIYSTSCTSTVDHIRYEHDGSGGLCTREPIVVKACTDSSCSSLYTSPVTLTPTVTPTGGTWYDMATGGTAISSVTFTGSTTLYLQYTKSTTATYGATGLSVTPTNGLLCDITGNATAANNGTECKSTFGNLSLKVEEDLANAVAGLGIAIAGRQHDMRVTAMMYDGTSPLPNGCNALTSYAPTSLKYALVRDTADPAGTAPTVSTLSVPNSPSSVTVPLTFSSGVATFNLDTTDVGKYTMELYDDSLSYSSSTISGSQAFIVRPNGFALSATCSLTGSSAVAGSATALTAASSKFCPAGANFSATATAVSYSGAATPAYGKEHPAETVVVSWSRDLPSTGSNGTLPSGSFAFSGANGLFGPATLNWDEVGTLRATLSVGDADYLGAGQVQTPLYLGRFYPDHFDTVINGPMTCSPAFATGCPVMNDGVTLSNWLAYSGQPIAFRVTAKARNAGNTTTTNYAGSFAHNHTLSAMSALGGSAAAANGAIGTYDGTSFSAGTPTLYATTFVAGESSALTASPVSTYPAYSLTATPPTPTNIYLRSTDGTDNISSKRDTSPMTTSIEAGIRIVRGRAHLSNAFGSELLPLSLPVMVELYDGSVWTTNAADSVSNSATTQLWTLSPSTATALSVSGATTFSLSGTVASGQATVTATAPGTGGSGYADVSITVPEYLRYPWTGGSSVNPSARADFGIYNQTGGSRRIIFKREVR
jgi:MSHA biogenesis protein MshQ